MESYQSWYDSIQAIDFTVTCTTCKAKVKDSTTHTTSEALKVCAKCWESTHQ